MGEIELPKYWCELLDGIKSNDIADDYPVVLLQKIFKLEGDEYATIDIYNWLWRSPENQWKLIDAIRYGYIPEKE